MLRTHTTRPCAVERSPGRSVRAVISVLLLIGSISSLFVLPPERAHANPAAQTAPRVGAAPIAPPPRLDVDISGRRALDTFSVDSGQPDLDTSCTFRSDQPSLTIRIPIDRYIAPTNNLGQLLDPQIARDPADQSRIFPDSYTQALIDANVVARSARLILPVFDVDSASGEVDHIFVNGQQLTAADNRLVKLTGSDGQWSVNSFDVPIEWLRFPAQRDRGGVAADADFPWQGTINPPEPVLNEIRIDIDVLDEGWCTAVDWVAIQINAMAPMVFIHGISANSNAWSNADDLLDTQAPPAEGVQREDTIDYLTRLHIPFEARITLPQTVLNQNNNLTIAENSASVQAIVERVARSFGVRAIHLVGHSKGGLDSRGYLAWRYDAQAVQVLSFHTIGTPHRGSVLANISTYRRRHPSLTRSPEADINRFLRNDTWIPLTGRFNRGPLFPGITNLTTWFVADFNAATRGTLPRRFFSYGADANVIGPIMGDPVIIETEAAPFITRIPGIVDPEAIASRSYRILRDTASIRFTITEEILVPDAPPESVLELTELPTTAPQPNDLVVTTRSSWLGFEPHADVDGNHQNMKDGFMMRRILDNINCSFPTGPQRPDAAPCAP